MQQRPIYSSQCADIASNEEIATSFEHNIISNDSPICWGSDPIIHAIRLENEAESLWESGISHLSKADFVHDYTSINIKGKQNDTDTRTAQ